MKETKYFCDVCKKETNEKRTQLKLVSRLLWKTNNISDYIHLDICFECSKQFISLTAEDIEGLKVHEYHKYLTNP